MSLNRIRSVFKGPGGLRGVWRVVITLAFYALWTTLAAAGLTLLFASLFEAWGVNTLNLHLAPTWARAIVSAYPYAISLMVNVPAALIMTRLAGSHRKSRLMSAAYFPLGMAAVIIPAAVFLLTDSLRAVPAAPVFHWAILMNLPVCLAAAWAEQSLTRDLIPSFIKGRFSNPIVCTVSAATVFVITRAWEAGVIGAANFLLMALLLLSVTKLKGSLPAMLLRAGWLWASASLMDTTSTEISLIPLYPVSENILTGASGGPICGLMTTIILAAALILIHKNKFKKTPET